MLLGAGLRIDLRNRRDMWFDDTPQAHIDIDGDESTTRSEVADRFANRWGGIMEMLEQEPGDGDVVAVGGESGVLARGTNDGVADAVDVICRR